MVLGPVVPESWYTYVSDLPGLVSLAVKVFAEDIQLYRTVYQASDVQTLQSHLDVLVGRRAV